MERGDASRSITLYEWIGREKPKKFLDCPGQYHAGIGGIVFETLGEIGPPQQTQWGENVECRTVSFTSSSSSSSFFFYFIWWIVFSADGKASHIRSLFIFFLFFKERSACVSISFLFFSSSTARLNALQFWLMVWLDGIYSSQLAHLSHFTCRG